MGNINDFKLVALKSTNYSKALKPTRELSDIERARFGFYLLVIDAVSHLKDTDILIESVIDTDFCSIVLGENNNDEGIDAVTIDDETNTINLFNFKYHEKFNVGRGQKLEATTSSMKFLMSIFNENTEKLDVRTKLFADRIIENLNSSEAWNINLYTVSNDNTPLSVEGSFISNLEQSYDMKINR